jgi:hypothetical protein
MIAIEDTLISDDLVMKSFVCNLNKCKGACCVQGDSGAPLKEDEVDEISRLLPDIKPFMNPQYVQDIEQNGFFETDKEGDRVNQVGNAILSCTKMALHLVRLKMRIMPVSFFFKNRYLATYIRSGLKNTPLLRRLTIINGIFAMLLVNKEMPCKYLYIAF